MHTGVIKKLTDRGFGFIKQDGGGSGKDLFFHCKQVQNSEWESLQEGQRVTFEIEDGVKGPCAVGVRVAA